MIRIDWTTRFKTCVAVALVVGTAWLAERLSTGIVTPEAVGSAAIYFFVGLLLATRSRSQRSAKIGLLLIALAAPWTVTIACFICLRTLN
jgi:thiol:disulfide interchange protein